MALLHYERWEELAPEMEAAEYLDKARDKLRGLNDAVVRELDRAMLRLHPLTRDPQGREEFAAFARGEFPGPKGMRRPQSQGEFDRAVRAEVERVLTERGVPAAPNPPQTPPDPEG